MGIVALVIIFLGIIPQLHELEARIKSLESAKC